MVVSWLISCINLVVMDVRKLPDLFKDNIKPRDVIVAEPKLGLGPLHTSLRFEPPTPR
jgi:nitrous oxide reductase